MSDVAAVHRYDESYPESLWNPFAGLIKVSPEATVPDAEVDAAGTIAGKLAVVNGKYVGDPVAPWSQFDGAVFGTDPSAVIAQWTGTAWIEKPIGAARKSASTSPGRGRAHR